MGIPKEIDFFLKIIAWIIILVLLIIWLIGTIRYKDYKISYEDAIVDEDWRYRYRSLSYYYLNVPDSSKDLKFIYNNNNNNNINNNNWNNNWNTRNNNKKSLYGFNIAKNMWFFQNSWYYPGCPYVSSNQILLWYHAGCGYFVVLSCLLIFYLGGGDDGKPQKLHTKVFILPGFVLYLFCSIIALLNYLASNNRATDFITDLLHCILCIIVTVVFGVDAVLAVVSKE